MKRCKYEHWIDDYLLKRLGEEKSEEFEKHYFDCSECFEQMTGRMELISVIKSGGEELFAEQEKEAPQKEKVSLISLILDFFTPKQWILATISATAIILIIIFGFQTGYQKGTPEFIINDDLVRGKSITLISPVISVQSIPSQFRWKDEGKDISYKISIYINGNGKVLWTASTQDTFIALPDDVQNLLAPGKKYSWQVKAFSPEGMLIAVSSRVQFMISPEQ